MPTGLREAAGGGQVADVGPVVPEGRSGRVGRLGRVTGGGPRPQSSAGPANLGRASESICNRLRDTSGGASHRGWEELALAGEPSAVGWRLVVVKMESYRFAGD